MVTELHEHKKSHKIVTCPRLCAVVVMEFSSSGLLMINHHVTATFYFLLTCSSSCSCSVNEFHSCHAVLLWVCLWLRAIVGLLPCLMYLHVMSGCMCLFGFLRHGRAYPVVVVPPSCLPPSFLFAKVRIRWTRWKWGKYCLLYTSPSPRDRG